MIGSMLYPKVSAKFLVMTVFPQPYERKHSCSRDKSKQPNQQEISQETETRSEAAILTFPPIKHMSLTM